MDMNTQIVVKPSTFTHLNPLSESIHIPFYFSHFCQFFNYLSNGINHESRETWYFIYNYIIKHIRRETRDSICNYIIEHVSREPWASVYNYITSHVSSKLYVADNYESTLNDFVK
jgi:hypothetical protein